LDKFLSVVRSRLPHPGCNSFYIEDRVIDLQKLPEQTEVEQLSKIGFLSVLGKTPLALLLLTKEGRMSLRAAGAYLENARDFILDLQKRVPDPPKPPCPNEASTG
jgi:hypothetical protein